MYFILLITAVYVMSNLGLFSKVYLFFNGNVGKFGLFLSADRWKPYGKPKRNRFKKRPLKSQKAVEQTFAKNQSREIS